MKHNVEYCIKLTGSKLFDMVMYNTAQNLCAEYPGLDFEYGNNEIKIFGELDEYGCCRNDIFEFSWGMHMNGLYERDQIFLGVR